MKEIKAIIRTDKAQEALDALYGGGAVNVTVSHVLATGTSIDNGEARMNMEFGRQVAKMVRLEVVCSDRDDLRLVEIIRQASCTGQKGDGIIIVSNVNRIMKIRNKCESIDALK